MTARQPYSASIRVRPRRDGTIAYDVRYRHNGASRTLSFDIASGAEKWANILRQVGPDEALAFLNLSTAAGTPTVAEYAPHYINHKSGIEPRTAADYRTYMRLHIEPVLGHLPIDAVSSDAIASWINLMAAKGAASKSIKNWHGFLSAMFQRAVDDGLISRNPCAKSKLPETESGEMVFLSPDEFTTLYGYIPYKYQPLILFLASTGLRWGEATALRPSDFDLDALTVRVSRAWKHSPAGWYIGPPKTKRSKRTVSLPVNIITDLRPLVENAGEYVFTNAYGKPVRQNNFYEGVWAPARRLANGLPAYDKAKDADLPWSPKANGSWDRTPAAKPIGKTPRIHDLRHSHASWLLAQGVGIDIVSRRLGHESVKTTLDVYGHVAPERLQEVGNVVNQILAGSMPQLES